MREIDVKEQRALERKGRIGTAQQTASGGSGGGASAFGRPEGCFSNPLPAPDGQARFVEVCPGMGGYRGLAAEAFGLSTLVVRDPLTGQVLPTITASTQEIVTIDPLVLAQRAAAQLTLPEPEIRMSPESDQVVNLPSWLWIAAGQWEPREVSASAGPVTSTVTATPLEVTWDMGNGDQVRCDGPGTPYRKRHAGHPEASDCTYTYRHSSAGQPDEAYDVTATITWTLTWTAAGAPGGGDLGTVETTSSRPVRVTEIQALVQ